MAREEEWAVLKAATTSWLYTTIPYEVAQLLDCTEDIVSKFPRHLQTLAWLNRGPERLRIVPSFNSQELLQRQMYDVVGICHINPNNAIRMTEVVTRHLGMEVHHTKEDRHYESWDPIAFVVPLTEYQAYMTAVENGKPYRPKEIGHVYVAKSVFKGKWEWPTVEEMEKRYKPNLVMHLAQSGRRTQEAGT